MQKISFLGRIVRALGRGQTDKQTYTEPTKDWRPMKFFFNFYFYLFIGGLIPKHTKTIWKQFRHYALCSGNNKNKRSRWYVGGITAKHIYVYTGCFDTFVPPSTDEQTIQIYSGKLEPISAIDFEGFSIFTIFHDFLKKVPIFWFSKYSYMWRFQFWPILLKLWLLGDRQIKTNCWLNANMGIF